MMKINSSTVTLFKNKSQILSITDVFTINENNFDMNKLKKDRSLNYQMEEAVLVALVQKQKYPEK